MAEPDEEFDMSESTCTVAICERRGTHRGLCRAHYDRLKKHGDLQPDKPIILRSTASLICTFDGCDGPVTAWKLCEKHYRRQRQHGDAAFRWTKPTAADSPKWLGDRAGYRAVHTRLRKAFGKAKSYPCVDCGRQAQDWSYDHSDPDEGYDERGCPFSTDLAKYEPRCKSCHARYDEIAFKVWQKRLAG